MTEPYDSLQPPQIATTLRSLPRRYASALAQLEAAEIALGAAGRTGESPLAIVDDAGRSLVVVDRGLEQTLLHDSPMLMAAVIDPGARQWEVPAGDRSTVLEALQDTADELADRIDGAPTDAWDRPADIAGGGTVTALDIAREAARTGVERLRDLERFEPA